MPGDRFEAWYWAHRDRLNGAAAAGRAH
jgi:hypothetical protein